MGGSTSKKQSSIRKKDEHKKATESQDSQRGKKQM